MNILIIKTGASGDVVRTTCLLTKLKGNIWWVTKKENIPLLPSFVNVIDIKYATVEIKNSHFDVVLSLDDEPNSATLVNHVSYDILIGSYVSNGKVKYTDSCSSWFDMGLISRLGIEKSNYLKKTNTHCYQYHLFRSLGLKFDGEEYQITIPRHKKVNNLISIETRCGERWPTKQWNKFDELAIRLKNDGYEVRFLHQRENMLDYVKDIAESRYLFCGDSLSLHLALATKTKTFAIFTCTPPNEIYDYGLVEKIFSSDIYDYLYIKEYCADVVNKITCDHVYDKFKTIK